MLKDEFEELIEIFGLKPISDHYSFLLHLGSKGISVADFLGYAKGYYRKKAKAIRKEQKSLLGDRVIIPCPECDGVLSLVAVSMPKGKQNKNGWKSLLFCTNEECLYEEFSVKDAEKVFRRLKKKYRIR